MGVALLNTRQGRHLGSFLGGSVVVVETSSFYHNDISSGASGLSLKITLEPDALGTMMQLVTPHRPTPLARRTRRLGSGEKPTRRAQRHPTDPVPGAGAVAVAR